MSTRWQYKGGEVKTGFLGLNAPQMEATRALLGQPGRERVQVMPRGMRAWMYLKKVA